MPHTGGTGGTGGTEDKDGSGAPPIRCDVPGSFPWGVLHERQPALVRRIRAAFPYPPGQQDALDALLAETLSGVVEPLGAGEPGRAVWDEWGRDAFGRPWRDLPFLWMESYFYRRLLGAVGYFGDGPWRGVDPFEPFKRAELDGKAVDDELSALDRVGGTDGTDGAEGAERDTALLLASLWGNRADLGFSMSGVGAVLGEGAGGLVADDSARLWALLNSGGGAGTVFVVADNAGRELLPDLVLVDHLLRTGRAARVVLHIKPSPYFVSDATTADVLACLRRLTGARGAAEAVGHRLWQALGTGRLGIRAHPFSCAPLPYRDMPDDLREEFAGGTLTIMKGDLNYRRLVGDRHWPPTTPFAEVTGYFPGPVAALRTLKSDVVTGLGSATLAALEATGEPWRVSGTHALVQIRE